MAERKHRHILEMYVLKYLWYDAILTAFYLINHMPSTPLRGEIPLRRLCPDMEIFSLTSRVFGCVAFVQDLTLNLDKLASQFVRCVFVGYSCTQQGYKCFISSTRKYIASADITLFET